jgi:hypothetical protein
MLTILLIVLILILVWGFRSLQSGQAEIACALRDLVHSLQPSESAQEREELLLRRAERDLMAPQQKTTEEQQQEAELWAWYNKASLPPQGKAAPKAGRLQVTPKRPECGQ